MKPFIPIMALSMLFACSVSAAEFRVEQLNLSELDSQQTVSVVNAGDILNVLAYGSETYAAAYTYAHKALTGAEADLPAGRLSQPVKFRNHVYVSIHITDSPSRTEVWRLPTNDSGSWKKVMTTDYHASDIFHVGKNLVIFGSTGRSILVSKNGITWKSKKYTGIYKKSETIQLQDTPVIGVHFQGAGYAAVWKEVDGYMALYRSANGIDWSEVGSDIFEGDTKQAAIGGFFHWNSVLYMLTTDMNGLTHWWQSTDGETFEAVDWNLPGNHARLMYKDDQNLMLAMHVDGTTGWTIWQQGVDEGWQAVTEIEGVSLGDSSLDSDYLYKGMKYKKAWYVLTEDRIPEGPVDANFNLLRITYN